MTTRKVLQSALACLAFLSSWPFSQLADAGQYSVLHDFTGFGTLPPAGGVIANGSTLYGTTAGFGGVVYSMNTDGTGFQTLHTFLNGSSEGAVSLASLTLSGSTLYGTTSQDGAGHGGSVFAINTNGGGFNVLHSFASGPGDGFSPQSDVTISGSKLYGTTTQGGASNPQGGTLFSMNLDGSGFQILRSFGANDGKTPVGGLTVSGSTIYGTASQGGAANPFGGTLFAMNTDGSNFHVLHAFAGTDGSKPVGDLTLAGSTLFGTTSNGGSGLGGGTVFSVKVDGSGFQLLHEFPTAAGGEIPLAGITFAGSAIVGTTSSGGISTLSGQTGGTLFAMNSDGSNFRLLHEFSGRLDGMNPMAGVTLVGSTLFGTTDGGILSDVGTVYSQSIFVPEPSSLVLAALGFMGLCCLRRH